MSGTVDRGKAKPPRRQTKVVTALVLAQVFFGLHYLAAKVLLETIPPRSWAVFRVAGAAVLLLALARALRRPLPSSGRDLAQLAFLSLFGVVINQLLFVEGLHRTTPSHSSIIMTAIPVMTLLFAVLLRRERVSAIKIVALSVSLAGVMLVIRPTGLDVSSRTLVGDVLTLINASSYALFLVLSRRLLARNDPLAATAVLMAFGTIVMTALGLPQIVRFDPTLVPLPVWGLGLFIVVFPTALAHFFNFWALARVESSLVALFIYLQPVIATVLSFVLLGERVGGMVLLGGAMVFLGVYMALPTRRPARPEVEVTQGP
jgi:drug/metabolite transporter (DMT)-like permease